MKKGLGPSVDAGVLIVVMKNQFLSLKPIFLGKDVNKGWRTMSPKCLGYKDRSEKQIKKTLQ